MVFEGENPYAILNVSKESSVKEIKKAYRKLARYYHPDKNILAEKEKAEKDFHRLQEAYEFLLDKEKRDELNALIEKREERLIRTQKQTAEKRKFAEELERREAQLFNKKSKTEVHQKSSSFLDLAREENLKWLEQQKTTQTVEEPQLAEVSWDPALSLKITGITQTSLRHSLSTLVPSFKIVNFQPSEGRAHVEFSSKEMALEARLKVLKNKELYRFKIKLDKNNNIQKPVVTGNSLDDFEASVLQKLKNAVRSFLS